MFFPFKSILLKLSMGGEGDDLLNSVIIETETLNPQEVNQWSV